MISEGSRDTEDRSNDTSYITGINYILQYSNIEIFYFNCIKILQYYCFIVFLIK